jgi:hypothetical protein
MTVMAVFGQDSLPVIKATSEKVDIRVGNEYFAKAGWALDPNKKPKYNLFNLKYINSFQKSQI